jgi:hypothetical protein
VQDEVIVALLRDGIPVAVMDHAVAAQSALSVVLSAAQLPAAQRMVPLMVVVRVNGVQARVSPTVMIPAI